MQVKDVFLFLPGEAHTVVMATADERGRPDTCAADVMDCDETGLYFLTARGKNFYSRLKRGGYVSLTGIKGDSTMTRAAASVSGEVREESAETLKRLPDKNPYMYEIYPTEKSRSALAAFKLYKGRCEWFDLSKKPIERFDMAFGGGETSGGYFVTDKCRACGKSPKSARKTAWTSAKKPSSGKTTVCAAATARRSALTARWKGEIYESDGETRLSHQLSSGGKPRIQKRRRS